MWRKKTRCTSFRRLYVDREYRYQDVGSMLVKECCRIAREEDQLETIGITISDVGLEDFYKKLGFHFSYEYE